MPNRRHRQKLQRRHEVTVFRRQIVGLLPLSCLALPLISASAQTTPSAGQEIAPASNEPPDTSLNDSQAPSAPPIDRTPTSVSELTADEPGIPVNIPPSFFGSSGEEATSSFGVPWFGGAAPSVESPSPESYPLQW